MDVNQAVILSNKLDKLNEFFDITSSTVDEIKKEVDTIEVKDYGTTSIVDYNSNQDLSIITIQLLKADFDFIRETLLETVKNGKDVLSKITLEIDIGESQSASIISAYAELVGTVNNSLKLLSSTYKDIVDLHIKLQKKKEEDDKDKDKGTTIKGDVTINTISASVGDIINAMKGIKHGL